MQGAICLHARSNLIDTVLSNPAQESFRIQTDNEMYPQFVKNVIPAYSFSNQFLEIEDWKAPSSKGFHGVKTNKNGLGGNGIQVAV